MRSGWISTETVCSTTRWPIWTATDWPTTPRWISTNGRPEAFFTDDGSGTWAVSVDRAGQLRWFGLDGLEHTGGPVVDLDGDGQSDDRLTDTDGNGLADRALSGDAAYVDSDGDGHWDIKLADSDGDGKADAATEL